MAQFSNKKAFAEDRIHRWICFRLSGNFYSTRQSRDEPIVHPDTKEDFLRIFFDRTNR